MDQNRIRLESILKSPILSDADKQWLGDYLQQKDGAELLQLLLEKFSEDLESISQADKHSINLPDFNAPRKISEPVHNFHATPVKKLIGNRFRWLAAAILIGVVFSVYWFLRNSPDSHLKNNFQTALPADVAAPSVSRPTIVLANGERVVLDSNYKGIMASEGGVQIERSESGNITYHGVESANLYNTLVNPRGSKPVLLTLSDGSSVWLNSESSLRYPVFFTGAVRTVEVTGEAYFEVAKNPAKPFRVNWGGKGTLEVLGTHFNINSYEDESATRITLLEGSVRVVAPSAQMVILKPGQQAAYSNAVAEKKELAIYNQVDLNAVVAWKNGYFNFQHADLLTVMRQLARWYDIEIHYEGTPPTRYFGGEMQRDLNLSEVLKLLEKNNVHFRIENRTLLVKP